MGWQEEGEIGCQGRWRQGVAGGRGRKGVREGAGRGWSEME